MGSIPINIAELVGGTPLIRLQRMLEGTPSEQRGVELYAKLEAFNPGGSVKDRIGVAMIEAAEAEGRIEPGAARSSRPRAATPASRSRSCVPPRGTSSC